jgi:hypothetical protein
MQGCQMSIINGPFGGGGGTTTKTNKGEIEATLKALALLYLHCSLKCVET